ncbi:pentatricopeptide repeat-containing protein 1, mitochondrial-like [Penaeus chinensis]|uniref:pentatricopeptide repeat-containing protein 1, mitochondrial-like n=1 Tax=Penaeus chinensis TaxID=139456 RepID=UPI001FB61422|nr:pentatricopeptide repeat-containing protein 1, mitochondrial-like [Penaeus chinensis]XP_047473866.1 pentatricopeptide repeat-containing protein 1, mitochondrial-like [Penaeus chinensis]
MYSVKSRLVTSPFLWHIKFKQAVTQPSSWLQFISTTQQNADAAKSLDQDASGKLAFVADQKHRKKPSHKKYESHNNFQGSHSQNLLKIRDNFISSSALKSSENLLEDNALEKWHRFKDVEYEKILKQSRNLLQDDSEDEYYFFRNGNLKDSNEKSSSTPEGIEFPPASDAKKSGLKLQNPDTYGTFPPMKNEHEEIKEDEGDRREEKFEETRLAKRHKPQYYGQQMKMLCKEKKLVEALKILEEEMPSVGAKPNSYCYNVLIGACGRAGYTKKAFQLYSQMKKRGLTPKHVVFTSLFNACANSPWPLTDGLQRATKLSKQLMENGVILNSTTSHAMIKAFGRCGDIKTAFQIVDEMVDKGLLITTESLNFLLQACITHQAAGFRHALLVWRKMRELKLSPDIYSYNLLVRCIKECQAGDPQLTSQLLQETPSPSMVVRGNQKPKINGEHTEKVLHIESKKEPSESESKACIETDRGVQSGENSISLIEPEYTVIEVKRNMENAQADQQVLPDLLGRKMTVGNVIGLRSLQQPEDRLALVGGPVSIFKHMAEDNVKPDIRTVTQMLESLPADTQAEEALLDSMKNIGIVPDIQFYNMLIRRRSFRRDTSAAKEVLDFMQEHHLVPDLITFGCLALGCHRLHDAKNFLKDMDSLGFRPNLEIMTSLVKNGLVKTDYYFTLEMLFEIRDRNIVPDEHLINILEKARKRARDIVLKSEEDGDNFEQKNRLKGMRLFLLEYKNWLKASNIQLPDHPWAQYRAASTNQR